ncbi:hypothetical protein VTL71DRAFT_4886 [Oculimacula yallundae]|uniref:Heterokaryon incompatibility domain-containing protein n=1 Tax=Oculimacula yallundae TaxID=86028 RepID=A0ABR4C3W3_9HELO
MPSYLRRILKDKSPSGAVLIMLKPSSTPGVFKYAPLSHNSRDFRLVILHPALEETDNIRCTLQDADLDNPGEFEALSYAWGDQTEKHTITLNNQIFEVSSNLGHALRNLRNNGSKRSDARIFWIDAICIDQQNKVERNSQVRRMDVIYKTAKQVIVWLGRYDEPEDSLITTEEDFGVARLPPMTLDVCRKLSRRLEEWAEIGSNVDGLTYDLDRFSGDDPSFLFYYSRLFNRTWFFRLWVFQEVRLARKVVPVCGRQVMDMEMAYQVSWSIYMCRFGTRDFAKICKHLWIKQAAERVRNMFKPRVDKSPLLQLLLETRLLNCTDPRDRLFAIRGMMDEDDRREIAIDYTQSTSEIYSEWAIKRIMRTGRLDAFSYCRESELVDHPSWVPDLGTASWWSDPVFSSHSDCNERERDDICYTATGSSFTNPLFSDDKLRLKLLGYTIGRIAVMSPSVQSMSQDWSGAETTYVISKAIEAWEELVARALNTEALSQVKRKQFLEVLWRGQKSTSSTAAKRFDKWYDLDQDVEMSERSDRQKRYEALVLSLEPLPCAVLEHTISSKIFVTDNGSIGIVRECCNAAVGDMGFLLIGGNTPYILRQDSNTPTDRGENKETTEPLDQAREEPLYQLKGSCYLQGYMDGEAMSLFRRGEIDFTPVALH